MVWLTRNDQSTRLFQRLAQLQLLSTNREKAQNTRPAAPCFSALEKRTALCVEINMELLRCLREDRILIAFSGMGKPQGYIIRPALN